MIVIFQKLKFMMMMMMKHRYQQQITLNQDKTIHFIKELQMNEIRLSLCIVVIRSTCFKIKSEIPLRESSTYNLSHSLALASLNL